MLGNPFGYSARRASPYGSPLNGGLWPPTEEPAPWAGFPTCRRSESGFPEGGDWRWGWGETPARGCTHRPPSGYPVGSPSSYNSSLTLTVSHFASTPETIFLGAASPQLLLRVRQIHTLEQQHPKMKYEFYSNI